MRYRHYTEALLLRLSPGLKRDAERGARLLGISTQEFIRRAVALLYDATVGKKATKYQNDPEKRSDRQADQNHVDSPHSSPSKREGAAGTAPLQGYATSSSDSGA